MTSSRLALIAVVALVLVTGAAAQQVPSTQVGPVEKRAKPITPENPIPKRIHSVNPVYPPEASSLGASGRVTVRVVLDEFGRVAEVRRVNLPLLAYSQTAAIDATAAKMATEAVLRAAAEAVEQWQYDPPAEGPIAFNVTFTLAPGSRTPFTFASQEAVGFDANRIGLQETVTARSGGPPPPPPPPPAPGAPVRVGGNVRAPQQVYKANPIYPEEAKAARIQGVVILEAIIGADGRVADARILRSIPALDQAALDAVRQWQYTPTMMNGVPVPVIMTVTVQFTLS